MAVQYGDNEYIKLFRKLINWEWYTDINTKVLFIHCLLRANWKAGSWKGIPYERGQFITSLATLAAETGLSVKKVRTALDHLIETKEITSERQAKGNVQSRIITVLNYDLYQSEGKQKTSKGQEEGKQGASKGQQYKNIKNFKEIKEQKDIYDAQISEIIDYFNQVAGKHYTGRSESHRKCITARLKEGYTVEEFKQVIDNMTREWMGDEKMERYLCPETIFNGKFETRLNNNETKAQKEKREADELHERQIEAIRANELDWLYHQT